MKIPTNIDSVDELVGFPEEVRHLVGFWLDPGCAKPSKRRSNWGRLLKNEPKAVVWNESVRLRIAAQLAHIRSWKVVNASFEQLAEWSFNPVAHWYIDPPYAVKGYAYRHNSSQINYKKLADWCLRRRGFVQVCENLGADWLPFHPLVDLHSPSRVQPYSTEALFEHDSNKEERSHDN
jgi:hypothetical protein